MKFKTLIKNTDFEYVCDELYASEITIVCPWASWSNIDWNNINQIRELAVIDEMNVLQITFYPRDGVEIILNEKKVYKKKEEILDKIDQIKWLISRIKLLDVIENNYYEDHLEKLRDDIYVI